MLGPVELCIDERQVPLPGSRLRGVVGVLALHANRVVAAERLLQAVWGPAPPKTARNSLQGQASRLRRLLAASGESDRLVFREPGYLLRVEAGELDLGEFQRLADEGRGLLAAGDAERAGPLLHAALGLWRGSPLEDADLQGLREEIARLEERRLSVMEDRLDADLGLGRHSELVAELEVLATAYPLRERLRRQQMLALYRSGRPADALAAFRDTYAVLRERLGIDPSPELDRLQRAMLARDPTLEPPPAPREQPVTTDAGVGPATAPVAADTAAAGAMPAPTARVAPAQLPAAVSSFVGRAEHLHQLDTLLKDEGGVAANAVVISALAGMAGVGKSALAVQWAHQAQERFPDGQLYVNLRGWAPGPPLRPIQALAGFLGALGVPAEQVPTEVEQAAGLYRTLLAGRRVLVVLDDAREVEQVRPLLPGSPGCAVLVTSRDRLAGLVAVDGAHPLPLDVLTADEAHALLVGTLGAERVGAEPAAAAELARLCAFLPLALRIAAANLTLHPERPIARLVAELAAGDRLATLAVQGDEQAAVRAAFDLSYATLAPEAQRLFRLLGLVPCPDVTAEAAAALAGLRPGHALGLLDRLADAHLLAQPTPGRYVLHDLLRLYAAEQADREETAGERDAATRGLLDRYLHTTDAAARLLYPEKLRLPLRAPDAQPPAPVASFDDHTQALAWLDAERANLVAAVQHAGAHGLQAAAWLLADSLRGYFWLRMHTVDWLTVARAGLAAAEADGDLRGQAAARLSLADLHNRQGRYQQAVEHYSRASRLARESGWPEGESTTPSNLGIVYWQSGRLREAADHLTRALEIDRETGWLAGQAVKHGNLGNLYLELGSLPEATDHLTQALALHRRLGSRSGEAMSLATLGATCHALGRLDQAVDHLTAALTLIREVGYRGVEAETLRLLAAVHRDAGRHNQALELAQAAVALARDTGDRQYETDALDTLATIHQRLARPDRARAHASRALVMAREAGLQLLEGQALATLAGIDLDQGEPDQARQHAEQALELHRATGHRLGQARALVTLGRALRDSGGAEAALPCWREALALFTEAGSPEADQIRALLRAARHRPNAVGGPARTNR